MKKLVLGLALCLLPFVAARTQERQQQPSPAAQSEPAKPTPTPLEVIPEEVFDKELKDLEGQSFRLSNYRGQVFVINVWATWCVPCRMEIPELNRIYKDYAGRGIEFVGLTLDDPLKDADAVKIYADELKMKYKLGFLDAETVERLLNGRRLAPQTFVVAADGNVVLRLLGFLPNREPYILRKGIENALNPPPAAGPSR